jgi:hypothetical protein
LASTTPPLKVITTTIDGILAAAGSVVSRGVGVQFIAWLIAPSTTSLVRSSGPAYGRPWILTSIGPVDIAFSANVRESGLR